MISEIEIDQMIENAEREVTKATLANNERDRTIYMTMVVTLQYVKTGKQ